MKEGQNRRRRGRNLSSITSDRINLDKCKENVIFFLEGELGLLLLNILCYGDMYWMILEQVLMVPCFKILKERKKKKEQQLYQKGFQDLLQSLLTSLQAGYSLNNSCRIALRELESPYCVRTAFYGFCGAYESGGSKTVCGCDRDCAKYRWERSGDFEKDNAALEV